MQELVDLSDEQQHDVMFYLGWPARTIVENSTHYNRSLHGYLKNLPQQTVDRVTKLLALIKETRTKLDATRDDANVTSVGEIKLDPKYTSSYIQAQYNRYIRELSGLIDIGIASDMGTRVVF